MTNIKKSTTTIIIDVNYITLLLLLLLILIISYDYYYCFFLFIDIMGPRREAHARDDVCTQYVRICMCVYRGRERER